MSFEGEVVLVSGGAGGLGEATVRRLHGAGAAVVIADVNDAKARALAEELGNKAVYVRTDVLDSASIEAALAAADDLGTLRYAVIAHGGFGVLEKVVNRDGSPHTFEGFTDTIALYLSGTYNVLRLAAAKIAKLDPELHAALKIFADLDGVTEAQFIEDLIVPVLRRRVADAKVAAERLHAAGIFGKTREA